ncbi:MAG: protein DA1 [Verrucomicrobiota bacterium]
MFFCFLMAVSQAAADFCAVCSQPIYGRTFLYADKIIGEKVYLCYDCSQLKDDCFACGLPVMVGALHLSDGRFFCPRDEKTAMLNLTEAHETALEVREKLDRLFARFTEFPTNLSVAVIDRVDLLEFKVPGNDYSCPNILGLYYNRTNSGTVSHEIKILSGLTRGALRSTCAHEYSHAWVQDNVPAERKKRLGHDAEEGFCELVAYLLMTAEQNERQKQDILDNAYTRGQIDWFVEAEKKFGFNDVLDWMRYGVDDQLSDDPEVLRNVKMPPPPLVPVTNLPFYGSSPSAGPETLMLKGVSGTKNQPLALINNQSFTIGESGKVRLGKTNVTIRCLAIRPDSVKIKLVESGEEHELTLPSAKGSRH